MALNVFLQKLEIEGYEVGGGEKEGGGKGEGKGGEVEGEGGERGRVEEEGEIMDLDELLRRERQKEEKRKIIAPEAQVSIVHKWQFVMLTDYPILLLPGISDSAKNGQISCARRVVCCELREYRKIF